MIFPVIFIHTISNHLLVPCLQKINGNFFVGMFLYKYSMLVSKLNFDELVFMNRSVT